MPDPMPPLTDYGGPLAVMVTTLGAIGTLLYRALRVIKSDNRADNASALVDDANRKIVEGLTTHIERLEERIADLSIRMSAGEDLNIALKRRIGEQDSEIAQLRFELKELRTQGTQGTQ